MDATPSPIGEDARPHVVRVYSKLDLGGIERQMLRVLPSLAEGRYRISLCLIEEAGTLADDLRARGVPIHLLPLTGRLNPWTVLRLASLLRRERADIVQAHGREANATATAAARLAGARGVVATIHNMGATRGRRRIAQDRLLDPLRDAVVAVSDRVKDDYCRTVGVDPRKCVTIYNGLDIAAFLAGAGSREATRAGLGLNESDRAVLTVARLHPQKAHETLFEAARTVVREVPSARFLLAGDGPRRAELEALAAHLGVSGVVRFLGARHDVAALCRASEVACLSSAHEGFSNVVVECLAGGLPIVATDVGGNAEAIEEGRSGFLVPAGDASGLARRLIALLGSEPLRARMARAARLRAERFSLDRTVEETEALYDRILEARG